MVLKLIVENDRNELSVHDFDGNFIAVGRAENNDLVLKERNVSRHHFQLEIVDNRIVIQDRGSFNSTFVNDRDIKERMEIFVGDIITIGDYNIYLEQDDDSSLKTTSTVKEGKRTADEDLLLAKAGFIGGKTFPLRGAETVIGSHASADVFLPEENIPPMHSKIIFDGNMYLLVKGNYEDNYSLIVNDMEVPSVDMRNGDEITVGKFIFEFVEKGEEYDPIPFLLAAEEERREKLRKDIESKAIKSVHDEDETEITEVKKKPSSNIFKHPLFITIFVAALITLVVVIIVVLTFSGKVTSSRYRSHNSVYSSFLTEDREYRKS